MKNKTMKTSTKSVAILKKENSMYNNMETFLKSKGFKCKKTAITIEPKDSKEEFYPEYRIVGTNTTTEGKTFNFIIEISNEIKLDGNKQVILHLEVNENQFLTLKPSSNGPLQYMIESFTPNLSEMTLPTTPIAIIEEPKEEIKKEKGKGKKKPELENATI